MAKSKFEYYLINVESNKNIKIEEDKIPEFSTIRSFVTPNCTILLVVVETETSKYYGLKYCNQAVDTLDINKVNSDATNWLTNREKAILILESKKIITFQQNFIPSVHCDKCKKLIKNDNLRSVAESGICWACRVNAPQESLAIKTTKVKIS